MSSSCERCADLNEQFQSLEFALPPGPIHGDAHTSNLLTDHGQVVLLDFEAVAAGPREWDLVPTAVACERFRLSEEHYREFADTYGFDVRTWAGYPVLREIRELTMTTWLMQNVGESAAVAAEFALRVASLRGERYASCLELPFDEPGGRPALETGAPPGHPFGRKCGLPICTPRPGTWRTAQVATSFRGSWTWGGWSTTTGSRPTSSRGSYAAKR